MTIIRASFSKTIGAKERKMPPQKQKPMSSEVSDPAIAAYKKRVDFTVKLENAMKGGATTHHKAPVIPVKHHK